MTFSTSTNDAGTSAPEFDFSITLAVAPRKKVWANKTRYHKGLTTRYAGSILTGLNAHSALAIALIQALGAVPRRRLRLLTSAGHMPRFSVVTEDAQFAAAVNAIASGGLVTTLRSARALFHPLKKALSRGSITTTVVAGTDTHLLSLRGWAVNRLTEERTLSRIFLPKLAAESQTV